MWEHAYHSTHTRARVAEHACRGTHVTARISQYAYQSTRITARVSQHAYQRALSQHAYQRTRITARVSQHAHPRTISQHDIRARCRSTISEHGVTARYHIMMSQHDVRARHHSTIPRLFQARVAMPSLLEAVGEIFAARLTIVYFDGQELTLELTQDGQTLTETRESLVLRPERRWVGGQCSLRGLHEEAAGRALQAARGVQQAAP